MQDSITLRYKDGKMAVLNATALGISDRSGVIYGPKGYIVVDNINNFEAIHVYDSSYKKIASYKRPKQISGYEYEIESCVKAMKEGWLECPEMPHSETLKMLDMMDFIRKTNGIRFPGEEGTEAKFEDTSAHNESAYQVDESCEQNNTDMSVQVEKEQQPEDNASPVMDSQTQESEASI